MRLDQRAALYFNLARRVGERGLSTIGVDVQPALGELVVSHGRGRRHQVTHVDLAGAAEDHTVTVHDHHRAGAVDLALNFAGPRIRVIDAVEHCPSGLLLEIDGGIAPDVEGFPVEDRLVGRLLDGHRGLAAGLALDRALGVGPALGQAVIDLQAALAQTVWDVRDLTERCLTPRRLRRLLSRNRRDAGVQRADGTRQLLLGLCLLVQRRNSGHLAGTGPRGRARLGSALVGKPAGTERRSRLGITGHHQQGDGLRQRLEAQDGHWGFEVNRCFAADHRDSSFFVIAWEQDSLTYEG
ncbi:hypothetical protein PS706_03316 [Pseudomonas fluorescens]|nr:hypothetical protein PS706_03316 [Pseudomonas fluorescens]